MFGRQTRGVYTRRDPREVLKRNRNIRRDPATGFPILQSGHELELSIEEAASEERAKAENLMPEKYRKPYIKVSSCASAAMPYSHCDSGTSAGHSPWHQRL